MLVLSAACCKKAGRWPAFEALTQRAQRRASKDAKENKRKEKGCTYENCDIHVIHELHGVTGHAVTTVTFVTDFTQHPAPSTHLSLFRSTQHPRIYVRST
jgi:hypothetical protein